MGELGTHGANRKGAESETLILRGEPTIVVEMRQEVTSEVSRGHSTVLIAWEGLNVKLGEES